MNAAQWLFQEGKRFGFLAHKSHDGDMDLRVVHITNLQASASDLIQLAANLTEVGYNLTFMKDNSIHVHAPHRKEHSWGNRGWDCEHGLTVQGCEHFHLIKKWENMDRDTLLETRRKTVIQRDECLGDLYRSACQSTIDEIDAVLKTR